MIQQSINEENNASANVDDQQANVNLQTKENQEKVINIWNYNNVVWRYFTLEKHSFIKCNICSKCYHNTIKDMYLEKHLASGHPKIIKEIQEEIKHTWLSQYFVFNVDSSKVKCIVNNCQINIFSGINGLTNHLRVQHKINESAKVYTIKVTLKKKQRNNTEVMVQQIAKEEFFTNTGVQQFDTHSQVIKYKKELPCTSEPSLIWRYFTSDNSPVAKCNVCNKLYMKSVETHLEHHLSKGHPQLLQEIQEVIREELKHTDFSSLFAFNKDFTVTCTVENCEYYVINIFHGTFGLMHHLRYCHNITTGNFPSIKKNDIDITIQQFVKTERSDTNITIQQSIKTEKDDTDMIQQLVKTERDDTDITIQQSVKTERDDTDVTIQQLIKTEKDNVSANTSDQCAKAHSQEKCQELTWDSNNLIWHYFTPKIWPVAKCNICNKYYNGKNIADLEDHLTHKHL